MTRLQYSGPRSQGSLRHTAIWFCEYQHHVCLENFTIATYVATSYCVHDTMFQSHTCTTTASPVETHVDQLEQVLFTELLCNLEEVAANSRNLFYQLPRSSVQYMQRRVSAADDKRPPKATTVGAALD